MQNVQRALLLCLSCGCGGSVERATMDAGPGAVDASEVVDAGKVLPGDLSITACPGAPSLPIPQGAPTCDDICGEAHCVPSAVVGPNPNFPACPDDGTGTAGSCVPDAMIRIGGQFVPSACAPNLLGGASVCVPSCFAGAFRVFVSRGACADGELCVPCTNPATGGSTGACDNRCVAPDAD
jgi:hypothetical protein